MTEFSAYKANKRMVKNLVDRDWRANTFFEFLKVKYISNINNLFKNLKKTLAGIYVTRIPIQDPMNLRDTSIHSIFFIWNGVDKLLLYDPNGYYDIKTNTYAYNFDKLLFANTTSFKKHLEKNYKIIVLAPRYKGIQAMADTCDINTQYIDSGGYCMFYNWIAIKYIIDNGKPNILQSYKNLINPKYYPKIFPKPATCLQARSGKAPKNTLEGYTYEIANLVFN